MLTVFAGLGIAFSIVLVLAVAFAFFVRWCYVDMQLREIKARIKALE